METITLQNSQQLCLQRKKRGKKYVLKKRDKSSLLILVVMLVFASALIYFVGFMCTYKWEQVRLDLIAKLVGGFFNFAAVPAFQYQNILESLVNTILLAFLTTIISTFIGLFFGLISARNLSNPTLSNIIRGFAGFIRAVPTIIWVLIFVSGYGLTATTAIIGMCFHSVAYFIKSYSEAFEEVSEGTIEALRATGASWWQIVLNAVLPSSFTKMISWIAMRSEMNFAAAVIIGPAVGVPGTIGSLINKCYRESNYSTMGLCIIAIFVIALIFEVFITRYKQKTLVSE